MAMTISIPLLLFVFLLTETFLGLAKATMIAASENKRNTYKKTLNFDKNEVFSNPFILGIVRVAVSFLRIKKCQIATIGMRISNHKNSLL